MNQAPATTRVIQQQLASMALLDPGRQSLHNMSVSMKKRMAIFHLSCGLMFLKVSVWIKFTDRCSIYRQMLEGAIGRPSYKYQNLDALENKLKAELRDKRFLLALDGLQSDVAQQERDQVRNTLNFGKRGSKILVTALSKDAAMSLGAKSPVEISEMDDNDFLDLFMHYALDGVRVLDSQKLQKLHSIGRGIANKLRRLPVAARRVGDRLCKKLEIMKYRVLTSYKNSGGATRNLTNRSGDALLTVVCFHGTTGSNAMHWLSCGWLKGLSRLAMDRKWKI